MDFLVMGRNKKFYDYPLHAHDLWEMLINIEGEGEAQIGGKLYHFSPGTIFCIRPGTMHGKRSAEGFIDGSVLITDFCFKNDPEDVHVFQDDERRSFYTLFKLALDCNMNPTEDTFGAKYLRSLTDAMQNLLTLWKLSTYKNAEVLRIQKELSEHVGDPDFDLNTLLESTPYSPNHFRKLFRDQCGCSPLQYYHQLQMQMAKQLILQHKTILSISDIARACGYEDPYYFSRLFKKVSGYSPMQFYKQSKKIMAYPDPVA